MRTDLAFSIEPVRNPINVVLSDGMVRNTYELRLRNMTGYDRALGVSVESKTPVGLELQGHDDLVVVVPANETMRQRVYLTAAPGSPASDMKRGPVMFTLEDAETGKLVRERTVFYGLQK
jgi:hypothetical protein